MKNKIVILILVTLTFMVVGCKREVKYNEKIESKDTVAENVEKTTLSTDEMFIEDINKSIKLRSEYVNIFNKSGKEKDNTFFSNCVKIESNILYKYKELDFKDNVLKDICSYYIEGIEKQEESLKFYDSDFNKYEEIYNEGLLLRAYSIVDLYQMKKLDIDEDVYNYFQEIASKGEEDDNIDFSILNGSYDEVYEFMKSIEGTEQEEKILEYFKKYPEAKTETYRRYEEYEAMLDDLEEYLEQDPTYKDSKEEYEKKQAKRDSIKAQFDENGINAYDVCLDILSNKYGDDVDIEYIEDDGNGMFEFYVDVENMKLPIKLYVDAYESKIYNIDMKLVE